MRRTSMYRHRLLGTVLLSATTIGLGIGVGTVWAAPVSPQERVDAAYKAMGMTDAITTLVVRGRMQAWDPGESESVTDPYKPDWASRRYRELGPCARTLPPRLGAPEGE